MKFDFNAARAAGYSDDEIADYLAKENNFDLSGALKSGYSASEVIDFLVRPSGGAQDLPSDITPSQGRSATPMGKPDPRIVDNRGLIQRVADFVRPEYKSVMEGYTPTPQEQQANTNRRLSYGAGPISQQTEAAADLVRAGVQTTDNARVKQVAAEMDRRGQRGFGDLMQAAKNETNIRAARDSKADEFRSFGQFAVDSLFDLAGGATALASLPTDIIAPGSSLAQSLREARQELESNQSDILQATRERFKERVQSEDGFLDKYAATVVGLVTNPSLSVSEGLKQVPMFLGIVGAGRLAGGAVGVASQVSPTLALSEALTGNAIRAGATTVGGTAASMVAAGGDAAGGVYEKLTDPKQTPLSVWKENPDYQRLVAEGKSSKEAIEEIATTKARMAAIVAAPLGLLGFMGAESAVASKGLGRATAEALTFAGAGKLVAKDLAGEQLEEGGTQLAGNVVARTVDPNQSLTEGVPEAMGTALVTSAPFAALGARAQYQDAQARLTNFTPADAPTKQAGMVDIEVPLADAQPALPAVNPTTEQEFGLDKLRMGGRNVSTSGASGGLAPGGSNVGGGVDLGGVDVAGPGAAAAGRGGSGAAGVNAPNDGTTVPVGDAGVQPLANLAPRYNNGDTQPTEQWFGRRGDGYKTEGDAQQALPGRQRMFPDLEWKIEQMPSGKYRLAGYGEINATGTSNETMAAGAAAPVAGTTGARVPGASPVNLGQAGAVRPVGDLGQLPANDAAVAAPAQGLASDSAEAPIQLTKSASAPISVLRLAINDVKRNEGVEIAPLQANNLSDQQKAAMALASMHGNTVTFYETVSGDPDKAPNGLVVQRKHILIDSNSTDAPIAVAMHEVSHGLPEHIRKPLHSALRQLLKPGMENQFATEFNYSADQLDEEIPAMITQAVMHKKEFWNDLRTAMGNRDFAEFAGIIIKRLDSWIKGVRGTYGQAFLDKYVSDAVKARELLVQAHSQAMKEQGAKPEATGTQRSNKGEPEIGARLRERIDSDFEGAVQEYANLKGTKGGRVLDADIARELSPEYRADRSRAPEVHEAVSDFIQRQFEERTTEPGTGQIVVFMAGGGGAGKSSAEEILAPILDRADTVLDGTLSSYDKAERNVQRVLDSGRQVRIIYVYREPVDALVNGVLSRAKRTGRAVPVDALVKGHAGSSAVVRKLQERFGDDPAFKIHVVDNSRGMGNAVLTTLDNITPVIMDGLKERFINAAEQQLQAGEINQGLYRATVGRQADAGTEAQGQVGGGQVRPGSASGIQQGGQPVGSQDSVVQYSKKAGKYPYTIDAKGRLIVSGDIDRVRFLAKKAATGTLTKDKDAVVFKAEDAEAVIDALKNEPKPNPRVAAAIAKLLGLSEAELKSTSLEFQTGEPGDRAFSGPLQGGIPETVQYLEDRRRQSGLRLLDIAVAEDQDLLAKLMAAEALGAIRSSGNALEWYDETIARTLAMAAVKYEELGDDVNAQTSFRLAIAIASQGLNVENNLGFAMRQYDAFRRDRKFPEIGEGESAEAMAGNFRLANELMTEMGPDLFRRFLATEFTIGELNQAGFDPGGELVDEKVLGSSVFGPKIGFGFYSNLNGNFEPVTMDMWFMRTIGRLTGSLRAFDAEKFGAQLDKFRAAFGATGTDGIYTDRFDADLVARARESQEAAIELARQVKKAHERDFRENRAAFDAGDRKKTKLVYAAETMIQSVDKPKDVPASGGERRLLREVVRKAVAELEKAYGRRVPPAAMQALIWYPEQELYKALGVKLSVTSQDYAGAIEKILTKEGYDGNELRTAAESGSRRIRQANGRNARGQAQGDGQVAGGSRSLQGDERGGFIRSRYERTQLEQERLNPKRRGVVFEVAPDPNNAELTGRWNSLTQDQRLVVSERVARDIVPKVLERMGTSGIIAQQVGSYEDNTNPSFVLYLDKGDALEVAKALGFALSQDSMMVLSPKEFKGGEAVGAIAIQVGDKTPAEIDSIYQSLREIEVKGERPIGGQSMSNGVMTILNYSKVPTKQLAVLVDQKLNKGYTILTRDVFAAFPDKKEYDYASEANDGRGSRADLRKWSRAIRAEATSAVERELASVTVQRSSRAAGLAEPARGPGARADAADGRTVTGIHYGSQADLSSLSGSAFGSGIRGAEQARLNEPGIDPRIKKRVYFYLTNNNADMPRPEAGLGSHVYRANLGNMFDPTRASSADVQRVRAAMQGSGPNAFESAVLDAGFRGYVNREQGTAVVLNADVPVAYEGLADTSQMRDRRIERVAPANATRQEGDEMVMRPTGEQMNAIIKARPALAKMAPSFRLEFGEARVKAAEVGAANRALAEAGASFEFNDNQIDELVQYSKRTKPDPKKTVIAYKLFRTEADRPGELFPLFVPVWGESGPQKFSNRDPRRHGEGVPMGVWYDAEVGESAAATKTGKPQVKSKLGGLAFRPGWHAGDLPIATHIGEKSDPSLNAPDLRAPNQVWAEVELPDDVDWQTEANKRGINKKGKLIAKEAHITDQIPEDGFYRYKTNSNMTGNWLIGGSMKVNRILSDDEVKALNDAAGTADLPRATPFDAKKYGFDDLMRSNRVTETPAFKRWFGDSKVVDAKGQPLIVYHGTVGDFNAFENVSTRRTRGGRDNAFFFTANPAQASAYAGTAEGLTSSFGLETGGNVMPVYLSLQNPLVFDAEGRSYRLVEPEAFAAAKRNGNDGIIFKNMADSPGAQGSLQAYVDDVYVAFRPEQIKSATGNNGEFDPANPDIIRSNRVKLADDLAEQEKFLQRKAEEAGYKNIDEFVDKDYEGFAAAAKEWRDAYPVDVMYSNRSRGINIRNDGENRYADFIVDGQKTMESRETDSLRPYVGQTVGIIRTGEGKAKLIGSARIGEPIRVDAQQFRELEDQHMVPAGSAFDIKPGGVKFLYPITEAVRFEDERDVDSKGIVAREVQFSNRAQEGWIIGRDELGRPTFGAGAKAYRLVADVANSVLAKLSLKPIDQRLSRAMRQMKVEIAQAREMTVDAAEQLGKLSQQEREMISDVIEGELKRGAKPSQRVLELAASMQGIMSEQTAELVRLGMLSEDAAGRWDGKYLPRFYESKLKDEGKAWLKAAKSLLGRTKTMQGIGGSNLKGRGLFQTIPVEELESWLAEGWEERDPNFDPDTDTEITVWRDYTRQERDDMGEIRDSMFRFVMGYNKSQRDISLGRLYENLANTVASKKEKPGYVQVPKTNVEDTYARRYGKLAGMWVPQEVLDHLVAFDQSQQNELLKMYLKGMSMWKEGKTVLNPVSHANNVLSNITMAHFAGVSYWDVNKYIAATRDLIKRDPMVIEAEDNGLWTGTMTQAELVALLPDQLKVLAAKTESKAGKAVESVWNAMSFWLRKPLGKAYEAEDLYFRYLIYRDARQRGLEPADAVDFAQKYIFTYDDLPKTARRIRDFALPFFAYTYKVVPTMAETALKYPWRYAAPAAALYAANAAMYAFAASLGGGDDEDWWTVIKRYVTDPEFRKKANELEANERKNLPDWMKGASLSLGTQKSIRLGVDELTGLPVFLDVSRIFPGGDLFDAHNNAGGVPLLAPITPNNPILTAAAALLFNKDTFRGTELVKKSDTDAEATQKRLAWTYQQIAPAIAIGNQHFDRAMNVIANQVGEPINLGFAEYTGLDKQGMPVQGKYAAMQTVGIKARPIDLDASEAIQKAETNKLIREIDTEISKIKRLENRGAISSETAERQREYQKEKRQRLKEGLTVDGKERE